VTSLLILICIVVVTLIAEGFFSGSEIAFISASKPKIFRQAKEKNPNAVLAKNMLSRPELLFSTTVVGTTLAMTCATTFTTLYIIQNFGYTKEWLNLIVLTPIILIFGEFVPKMIFRTHADTAILRVSRPLYFFSFVLYPLTRLLSFYAQLLKIVLGESPDKGFFLSREEIKAALPASHGSDVTPSERRFVERILEFGKTTVKEMFHPLIDVIAIEENQSLAQAAKLVAESGHSRIPVYRERIDRIVGLIHGIDCLRVEDLSAPVKTKMQPALFVPESKPLDELLLELKTHPMAIAVNEYGGAEGIITMEDVVEEIVGEIEDEYDQPPKLYYKIGENSYIVNARMEIDIIREELNIPVPKNEDYQTLAGFLLKRMEKIPKKWDSTVINSVEYIVQSATDRSIEEVYIIVHPPKEPTK